MKYINPITISTDMRGTLTLYDDTYAHTPFKVVFQGCAEASANFHNSLGKPMMHRAYVIPFDPKTPAQITRRRKMADAVIAWRNATNQIKSSFVLDAQARQISTFNAFVSHYLRSH